jgi:hypothetical protein
VRWRQVVLLWIVAVALGAQYWFVDQHRPEPDAPQEVVRPKLVQIDPDAVTSIRLTRGGRTLVVQRPDDGRWQVVEPAGVNVPHDLVRAFLQALVAAEEIDQVTTSTGGLEAFGFGDGASTVEIGLRDGSTVALSLGSTNPTGTALYARRAASPAVVLIGRQVRYYEDLLFHALPAPRVPADTGARVGAVSGLTIHPAPV